MDRINNGIVPGTSTSSVATVSGNTFGTAKLKNTGQQYLDFDGISNFITVTNLSSPCILNPDSSLCPHGLTMSFVFKKIEYAFTTNAEMVIDTIVAYGNNVGGYQIYFSKRKIEIWIKVSSRTYRISSGYNQQQWNHFAFTFSSTNGLTVYMNGIQT